MEDRTVVSNKKEMLQVIKDEILFSTAILLTPRLEPCARPLMVLRAKLHCFCSDGFELIVPSSVHVEVVL